VALNAYISQLQTLLHDPQAVYYSVATLTNYINLARNRIALKGQCIRVLIPSTGPISAIPVTNGGAGYGSPPTVTINGVGTGASATAVLSGNSVASVTLNNGGSGYDKTTTISFSGGGGSGAAATATVNVNNTVTSQEIYTFASVNPIAQQTPGVQGIHGVQSIAVNWGSQKPMLNRRPFSDIQAYYRANNTNLQNYPTIFAQYGQGANGSVYMYPKPSQILQWDWDTLCFPIPLVNDTDPEAVPYPWTDAIAFFAAHMCFRNSQRKADAADMLAEYERIMLENRAETELSYDPDPYAGV
jgi:hypothetical protein